jgi:uncharacterized protein YebE (UPF0316 family)
LVVLDLRLLNTEGGDKMGLELLWVIGIFLARVTDMSMATIRTILLVRGKKLPAAIIGFFEVLIFVLVLSKVMSSLNSPQNVIAYCLGFATGNYVGAYLEGKLAIGFVMLQVISKNHSDEVISTAREHGLGVTIIRGEGREGERKIINIHAKRKWLGKILGRLNQIDPEAYVTVLDSRQTIGGFFGASMSKKA